MSILKLFRKGNLPTIFLVIPSFFILFSYFTGTFTTEATHLTAWPRTIGTFSIVIGAVTLLRYHGKAVARKREGWYFNVLTLAAFTITFFSSYVYEPLFNWIVSNVTEVVGIALSSFFGFYNYTLFYRAARARSFEVGLLIISSIFVMMWMAPIGAVIHPAVPAIGRWINDIPNGGAMRGILITLTVGMIGLFLRSVIGYEKAYVGGE